MARGSVLIVDDDPATRETIAQALRDAGYRVHAAASGAQALVILEQTSPSLVLLDLMMPGMGGWQLLEIFKANARLCKLPVVLVTASDHPPSGPYRVLKKPFEPSALLAVVTEHCGPAGASS